MRPRNNLPTAPPLVGRTQEMATLLAALSSSPVVTLWGPAGIGKTSLALTIMATMAAKAAGAAVFCGLSLCTTRSAVIAELAQALGLRSAFRNEDECLGAVEKSIGEAGPTLIVMDNAEQVIDEVADLLRVLGRGQVRFLVTSREPLQIAGELVVPVPPLALPTEREPDAAAAQLFRARATAANPSATPTDHACERTIVERLGGIPLAIELAAARLDVLTAEELAARLDEWPALLRSGRRDIDERHRTLVRAIDFSWGLLAPLERRAMEELSLFRGRFHGRAAGAVLTTIEPAEDVLQSLVRKSLLSTHHGERTVWFSMLPTVREFASQRQQPQSEARARYTGYVIAEGHAAGLRFEAPESAGELGRFRADLDGIADEGSPRDALEALAVLAPLAVFQGPIVSFAARIAARLDDTRNAPEVTAEVRARALQGSGEAHYAASLLTRALSDFEELCARAPNQTFRAHGLIGAGRTLNAQGVSHEAEARVREGLAIAEPLGNDALSCEAWTTLGTLLHHRGALADAHACYTRSLRYAQGPEVVRRRALVIIKLGFLEHDRGNPIAARALFAEAREAFGAVHDARHEAHQWGYFGNTYRAEGNVAESERHYLEALRRLARIGDRMFEGVFMMDLGALYLIANRFTEARRVLARAKELLGASYGYIGTVHAGYEAVARALTGDVAGAERQLAETETRAEGLLGAYTQMHARTVRAEAARQEGRPGSRQAVADALATELLGLGAPANDHIRVAQRLVEQSLSVLRGEVLRYGPASFHDANGAEVPLAGALARLFSALIAARRATPGAPLSTSALLKAGWPGERVQAKAGAIRVRVSIAKLRSLGLGERLRSDGGYFLDPAVPLRDGDAGAATSTPPQAKVRTPARKGQTRPPN